MMHSFRPNCTFPRTNPPGFVYNANIRSTLDILWSCTSIIVLSTWSILHLTVPADIATTGKMNWLRKQMYLLGRKLCWMGVMLMFPEYLLAIGASNLFVAYENHKHLAALAREDIVRWSRTHTIQADMGGMAIRFSESSIKRAAVPSIHSESQERDRDHPTLHIAATALSSPAEPLSSKLEPLLTGSTAVPESTSSKSPPPAVQFRDTQSDRFLRLFADRQPFQFGDIPWKPFQHHITLATEYVYCQDLTHITPHNHLAPFHGNIWILDSKQLYLARKHNVITRLPNIAENEIDDKSKSDGLVRLLALTQVTWLVIQLCVRRSYGFAFSALEISTLAFSACAFIIYLIEWVKPKDVAVPIYIDTDAVVSSQSFKAIVEAAPNIFYRHRAYSMPQSSTHRVIEGGRFKGRDYDRLVILVSILSTALFGGIHLFAWQIAFPSFVEKVIWRVSALSVAVIPTICALIVLIENLLYGTTHRSSSLVVPIFGPLYIASRLALLVESFRSLYFLPSSALTSTWASYIPHIT